MSMQTSLYPQDITGTASTNLVGLTVPELHSMSPSSGPNANYVIPDAAPFFGASMKVYAVVGTTQTLLTEGVDYALILRYISASYAIGLPIYGGVAMLNSQFSGQIALVYQTLGGNWGAPSVQTATTLINDLYNPMTVSWDQISGIPTLFPPQPHQNSQADFTGFAQVITAINGLQQAIITAASDPNNVQGQLAAHLNSPTAHAPSQVGLGSVANYPIATDTQAVQGVVTNAYMTPYLTAQAIANMNSLAASKLTNSLQILLSGAVTGSVSFVGSEGSVSLATAVGNIGWGTLTGVPSDLLGGLLNTSRIPPLPGSILIANSTITAGVNVNTAPNGSNNPVPLNQLQNYSTSLSAFSVALGSPSDNVILYEVPASPATATQGAVGGFSFGVRAGNSSNYQWLDFLGTNALNLNGTVRYPAGTLLVNGSGIPIAPAMQPNQAVRLDQLLDTTIIPSFSRILIGANSIPQGFFSSLYSVYAGGGSQCGIVLKPLSDNTNAMVFMNAAGNQIGSISQSASNVTFNGNFVGNLVGNVTGNISGSAAYATNAGSANSVAWTALTGVPVGVSNFAVNLNQALTTTASVAFANVTVSGTISGNLVGNVTGTITGNVNSPSVTATAISVGNNTISGPALNVNGNGTDVGIGLNNTGASGNSWFLSSAIAGSGICNSFASPAPGSIAFWNVTNGTIGWVLEPDGQNMVYTQFGAMGINSTANGGYLFFLPKPGTANALNLMGAFGAPLASINLNATSVTTGGLFSQQAFPANVIGTTYTNTTPYTKYVTVICQTTADIQGAYLTAFVNGNVVDKAMAYANGAGVSAFGSIATLRFFVQPGDTYSITQSGSAWTVDGWIEQW